MIDPFVLPATIEPMADLGHIAAILIGCGAALIFAVMAWAGRHQS